MIFAGVVYLYFPETAGKSLEQLDFDFAEQYYSEPGRKRSEEVVMTETAAVQ